MSALRLLFKVPLNLMGRCAQVKLFAAKPGKFGDLRIARTKKSEDGFENVPLTSLPQAEREVVMAAAKGQLMALIELMVAFVCGTKKIPHTVVKGRKMAEFNFSLPSGKNGQFILWGGATNKKPKSPRIRVSQLIDKKPDGQGIFEELEVENLEDPYDRELLQWGLCEYARLAAYEAGKQAFRESSAAKTVTADTSVDI